MELLLLAAASLAIMVMSNINRSKTHPLAHSQAGEINTTYVTLAVIGVTIALALGTILWTTIEGAASGIEIDFDAS